MKIEKLSDSNIHAGKQIISFVLPLTDQYIEENRPKDDNSKMAWNKGDKEAPAVIDLAVSDEPFQHVSDAASGKDIQDMILNIF